MCAISCLLYIVFQSRLPDLRRVPEKDIKYRAYLTFKMSHFPPGLFRLRIILFMNTHEGLVNNRRFGFLFEEFVKFTL